MLHAIHLTSVHVSLSQNISLINVIEESKSPLGEAASIIVNKMIYIYEQWTMNRWSSYLGTVFISYTFGCLKESGKPYDV